MRRRLASIAATAARASVRASWRLMPAPAPASRRLRSSAALSSLRSSRRSPRVVDVHVDRGEVEPAEPLDLVRDLRANGRRDLGEVEAVLDDDVQVDAELAVLLGERHRRRGALAAEQPPDARAG